MSSRVRNLSEDAATKESCKRVWVVRYKSVANPLAADEVNRNICVRVVSLNRTTSDTIPQKTIENNCLRKHIEFWASCCDLGDAILEDD